MEALLTDHPPKRARFASLAPHLCPPSAAEPTATTSQREAENVSADHIETSESERRLPAAAEPESAASSAISGLVAGAAVSTSKQLLLYPVDTVKVGLCCVGRIMCDTAIPLPRLKTFPIFCYNTCCTAVDGTFADATVDPCATF